MPHSEWSVAGLLTAVEAAWTSAYGEVRGRGSVSFVGTPPVDVLRFGPDGRGRLRYTTVGMARMPMVDPTASVVDPVTAPRAELVLTLSERRDSVLRAMAALACAPAVDGLILAPDSTVDTGQPLWEGAEFTAVLLDPPILPDVAGHPTNHPTGRATDGSQPVWLLPVVPITATELAYRRIHGAAALRAAWQEAGTDLVSPWRSAAR